MNEVLGGERYSGGRGAGCAEIDVARSILLVRGLL